MTQNPKMWRVPQERECIVEYGTRVFCLDDPSASKTLKGLVVGRHLLSMRRRLARHEACFWRMRLQDVRKEMR